MVFGSQHFQETNSRSDSCASRSYSQRVNSLKWQTLPRIQQTNKWPPRLPSPQAPRHEGKTGRKRKWDEKLPAGYLFMTSQDSSARSGKRWGQVEVTPLRAALQCCYLECFSRCSWTPTPVPILPHWPAQWSLFM